MEKEGKKEKEVKERGTASTDSGVYGTEPGVYDDIDDDDYEDPIDPSDIDISSRGHLGYQEPGVYGNQGQGHYRPPVLPSPIDGGYIGWNS